MALLVTLEFCETCDGIVVRDTTGNYDAVDNPTGYGPPHADFGEVIPFTVSLTVPGGTSPIYTLDLLDDPPAADSEGVREWTIAAGDMGLTEITSGVWTIVWVAGDDGNVLGGTPQGDTVSVLMYREIMADVNEKIITAEEGCDDDAKEAAHELDDRLCGAIMMTQCGNATKAQAMIESIEASLAQCC